MKNKKPKGLIIIGLLHIVIGIFIFMPTFLNTAIVFIKSDPSRITPKTIKILSWILVVLGIKFLILSAVGIGILKLKNWARITSMVITPLWFTNFLISSVKQVVRFAPDIEHFMRRPLRLILAVIIYCVYIYFFTRTKIKKHFIKINNIETHNHSSRGLEPPNN